MRLLVVGGLLLLVAVTVFALQNPDPVTVKFLRWSRLTTLAMAVIVAAAAGGLVVYAVSLFAQRDLRARLRRHETRLQEFERERTQPTIDEMQRVQRP